MALSYNVKQIGSFYRVSLYRNGKCFFASALMTKTIAEHLVTNINYVHTPNVWSKRKA
jgi:hypothetical protein